MPQDPGSRILTKDFEKLRKRMWTMKHRVCLLEFGLGSVAKLVRSVHEDHYFAEEGKSGTCEETKYKRTLEGIGEILQDIEDSVKLAYPPNYGALEKTELTVKCEVPRQESLASNSCQHCGRTSPTSDLCTIRVVENPVEYQSLAATGNDQHFVESETCSYPNMSGAHRVSDLIFSTTSLDALSTLAVVATSKIQEREVARGGPQSHRNPDSISLGQETVSTQENDQVPPKKRRRCGLVTKNVQAMRRRGRDQHALHQQHRK